jgi:3-oxoacyl-[acyl-carrier-protein] synthase-3
LINAGVYHDDNLGEPALAAIIQRDIGATQRTSDHERHGTFSFDVQNGGAGVVTAMYLMNGFLGSTIELGMVVASDAEPGSPVEPEFPFAAAGGAVLLAPGTGDEPGFVTFRFDTYPEFESLLESRIVWHERRIGRGRNVLELHVHPGFADRAVDCAAESTRRFLDQVGLRPEEIDLLIASPWPLSFADALAERVEIPGERLAHVSEDLAGAYTAGPLAAIAAAQHDGRWSEAKTVLLVTVGAGIHCALALYRR